jgi:hypothetical protein
MEKWKQNWDEDFMDEVKRERGEKKRGEREKNQNVIKCLETEKDERFNTLL